MTQEDATVTLDDRLDAINSRINRGIGEGSLAAAKWRDALIEVGGMIDDLINDDEPPVRDALSVEGREEQVAAIAAALHNAQIACEPFSKPGDHVYADGWPGGHPFSMHNSEAAALYVAGLRFRPSETLDVDAIAKVLFDLAESGDKPFMYFDDAQEARWGAESIVRRLARQQGDER